MWHFDVPPPISSPLTHLTCRTMVNELPATNWLGYSLDMLQTTPMDIKAVSLS